MEEGKLAKWLVKEGDIIKSGTILAEIETDKATMEFEAVDEGRIGQILVAEGTEGVKVNSPIATLLAEGEAAAPPRRPKKSRAAGVPKLPKGEDPTRPLPTTAKHRLLPKIEVAADPEIPAGTEMRQPDRARRAARRQAEEMRRERGWCS